MAFPLIKAQWRTSAPLPIIAGPLIYADGKTLASLASYVMHLIDRFMNKLQLMSDKD